MDTDKNGEISYIGIIINLEFLAGNIPPKIYQKTSKLKEVFQMIDIDK